MSARSDIARKCLAEFLGVFILCTFGNGSVAQVVLIGNQTWLGINMCYGLAVTMAVIVTGKVSGGHINPAVSLAESIAGRLKWVELPFYVIAQISGGFVSSVVLFGLYSDMEKSEKTSGIFATYPRDGVTLSQAFMNEVVGTFFLVLCVRAIVDKNNNKPPGGTEALFIGLTVFTIGASMGVNTGYAINPARDLGPRLFTYVLGFPGVFSRANDKYTHHFWIPILAPLIGAQLGALLYKYAIELHLVQDQRKPVKSPVNETKLDLEEQALTTSAHLDTL